MRVNVLGPFEASTVEAAVSVVAMPRRLLAVLVSRAGRSVGESVLIDALWPHDPPANARKTIQIYIHRLRQALDRPDRIQRAATGYRLVTDGLVLDAERFDMLVRQADRARAEHNDVDAARLLAEALDLWRGLAYEDFADCLALTPEIERLDALWLKAIEERNAIELRADRYEALIPELTRLTARFPYRERFHAQLMYALYREDRRAEALTVYRTARDVLSRELGIEPGPRLQRLHRAVLRGETLTAPTPAVPADTPAQLPPDVSSLIGRDDLLDDLFKTVDDAPGTAPTVVVIDGMPGVGKTALAVRFGHRLASRYPDGRLHVDLRGYTDGADPVPADRAAHQMLRALGVPDDGIPIAPDERIALWRSRTADRRLLILLDNAADDAQLEPLIPASGRALVLATSRRPLTMSGDFIGLTVPPLTTAATVGLFTEIVGAYRVTSDGHPLRDVATATGGLPLAVRILANRLRQRPQWTIGRLLERHRPERTTAPPLETAVENAFALSYRHLTPTQRRVFRLLALHPGDDFSATVAAALADLEPTEAALSVETLVDCRLLESPRYDRYTFHDLLRSYARERLHAEETEDDRRAARTRLLDHYRHAAGAAMDRYAPNERARWAGIPEASPKANFETSEEATTWAEAERRNLVAVVALAANGGWPEHANQLSLCLFRYLHSGAYATEALSIHGNALEAMRRTGDRNAQGKALNDLGATYMVLGDYPSAARHYAQAVELFRATGNRLSESAVLTNQGSVLVILGRPAEAVAGQEKAAAILAEEGMPGNASRCFRNLASTCVALDRADDAIRHTLTALRMAQEGSDEACEAEALWYLGMQRLDTGHTEEAQAHLQRAHELAVRIGHSRIECGALDGIGIVHRHRGDRAKSLAAHDRALALAKTTSRIGLVNTLINLGETQTAFEDFASAIETLTQAAELSGEIGAVGSRADAHRALAIAHKGTGDVEEARRWLESGRELLGPNAVRLKLRIQAELDALD
ncbi:BTAD domain-containing putative transcriptional regulator [Stackebrandtia soli]|uniref:AfsR/SARP family transcriptional regulator n=1 Tax=Stackebrandtia soli TaxID=1892856 RepID=UPI0039E883AF